MVEAVRYQRNAGIDETRIENDVFLVVPGSDDVFYLDAVGAGLWRLLAAPHRMTEIEEVFAAAFPDVASDRVARDLAAVLAEMVARRLVIATS
jgi:hypothetical protein